MAEKKRIISIVNKLIGIGFIFFGLVTLYMSFTALKVIIGNDYSAINFFIMFLFISIFSFISAYGLLTSKKWGKVLTIILSLVLIIKAGYSLAMKESDGIIGSIIFILIFVIIIIYLIISKKAKQ